MNGMSNRRPRRCAIPCLSALLALLVAVPLTLPLGAAAQTTPPAASLPADPWPRDISIANAAVLVYQPQVNSWVGNQLDFRVAMALKPTGAKDETFGSAFVTARTQVDKVSRTVVFENVQHLEGRLPDACRRMAQTYAAALQASMASNMRSISLDRLEASLALAGVKPATVQVKNDPPAGHRQQHAGHSGARGRRAGVEASDRGQRASSASSTPRR